MTQCYCCCYSQRICYNSCSYLISIEDILTWIFICLLAVFFYDTIKIWLMIVFIILFIYLLCKQIDIRQVLKEFSSKKHIEPISADNQSLNISVNEIDSDQKSLLNKPLLNSST